MQTIRAKSLKWAQGFNLLLRFDSAGFTEGNWQPDSNIAPEQGLQIISQGCLDVGMSLLFIYMKNKKRLDRNGENKSMLLWL